MNWSAKRTSMKCDTLPRLAGCRQTPKPTSWEWEQPWLSGGSSSTSTEQTTKVRTRGEGCDCTRFYLI
ncbi:hypothetical protein CCH79_00015110, partial [Gambusia affinis]